MFKVECKRDNQKYILSVIHSKIKKETITLHSNDQVEDVIDYLYDIMINNNIEDFIKEDKLLE